MTIMGKLWRAFGNCTRGAVALEFGLIAPLLLATLALSVELGRAYQAYRMFENGVDGIARGLAGFPEYDLRARAYAPFIAASLLPQDWRGRFDLQITSLQKNQGAMQAIFTHTLLGNNPGLSQSNALDPKDFEQSELVIYITAAYNYVPIFDLLGSGTRMTKTFVVAPYFTTKYAWNDAVSADKYVK